MRMSCAVTRLLPQVFRGGASDSETFAHGRAFTSAAVLHPFALSSQTDGRPISATGMSSFSRFCMRLRKTESWSFLSLNRVTGRPPHHRASGSAPGDSGQINGRRIPLRLKNKRPRRTLRSNGDEIGGWEFATLSFPVPALGAVFGCRLPDAILHGKRSMRPRSRAVQRLAVAEFRVRLFSSLRLVVAPPACEPGQDTSVTSASASPPVCAGSAAAFGSAFAPCHGSRLFSLRLLFAHKSSGVVFNIADVSEVFHGPAQPSWSFPAANAPFVPPFGVFLLADLRELRKPPESSAPC